MSGKTPCVAFALAFTIAGLVNADSNYAFITLGDWGGAALGGQDYDNVYAVAGQMVKTASSSEPKFIVNTGDNFYWCGIKNTSDFQIGVDYEQPYADASLQVKWYSALGNHEYGYNVQAQLDYSKINTNWVMPDRYYSQRMQMDGDNYLSMIVIDTSPCVSDYRESNPNYWDPCSTQYPTCSLISTDDDFEGPCQFHENILSQDCSLQYYWFQTALAAVPADDWLLVIGHHPIDEVDVEDFTTMLQQRSGGFSLYLNGHTHTLNQYTIDYTGIYLTSGAGSLVNTADQSHPVTRAKALGEDLSPSLLRADERKERAEGDVSAYFKKHSQEGEKSEEERGFALGGKSGYNGHTYQTVYNNKVAGFMLHTFNAEFTELQTDFVAYTGEIVHSFTSNKQGNIISSSEH